MTGLEALPYLKAVAELGERLRAEAKKSLDDDSPVVEAESYVYAASLCADLAEWLAAHVSDKANW